MTHLETAKQVISAPILEKPPSGQQPTRKRTPRDAETLAEALVASHGEYAEVYKRREQRACAEFAWHGQLADLERKTVEPMVWALKGPDPSAGRAVQQFRGEGTWDDAALLERRERLVAQDIGQADGVLLCDGSGFPKQGPSSVGGRDHPAAPWAKSPTVNTTSVGPMPAAVAIRLWSGAWRCRTPGAALRTQSSVRAAASPERGRCRPNRHGRWRGARAWPRGQLP